jgi:hypothetical protein
MGAGPQRVEAHGTIEPNDARKGRIDEPMSKMVRELSRAVGSLYRHTVRRFLPVVGYTTYQGVRLPPHVMPEIRMFDESLPKLWHAGLRKGTSSQPETNAHRELTRTGDHVVVIGGAWGVSAVVAAMLTGTTGKVTVFEGSKRYATYTEETIRLNDVSDRCTVIPCVVGPEFGVYDGDLGERVDPRDLPACDVIEMDVEGAELDILKGMTLRPRVLIVEMHPRQGPYSTPIEAYDLLIDRGYRIERCYKQDGTEISQAELLSVLADPKEKPPIVAAQWINSIRDGQGVRN